MKKLLYSIAGAFLLTMGSCDSLDLAPIDYTGAGNFWQNEGQVNTFMNGLHGHLRGDYSSPFLLGEVRGGTLIDGTSSLGTSVDYSIQITNALTIHSTGVSNWNGYYSKILQVNHFIDEVSNNCNFLSAEKKNAYLAQAHGIRAYYYFMLYKTFGGVPLELEVKITSGAKPEITDLYMKRSSAADVMQFLKDEINASEQAWGSSTTLDRYMWSKYATLFLKAEIYMWAAKVSTNDYEKAHTATGAADLEVAKKALNEIINSGKFELEKNFGDIFAYDNKENNEIILAMPFDRNETTNSGWGDTFVYSSALFIGSFYDEEGNVIQDPLDLKGSGWFKKEYREELVKSFDKTDARRAATFLEYYSSPNMEEATFGVSTLKYLGHVDGGTRYYDSDVIMMRYADVLLMMAECENGLGNSCAPWINQVRERAYGDNYSAEVTYTDGDYAANELAILKERDKEFVAEGKRWFDLIRMHDANKQPLVFSAAAAYSKVYGEAPTPVLDKATEEHKLLWPVNVAVLTADPELEQTWGYDEAE
ncbi:MAG: RagB/SusD family nutrient uptake outer membrane protein [Bacteroidaceae bacterium]|nr:RagB/SusD family nutrient uptake outer membrane protein [Bacteroidaceae bacterium]